MAKLREAAQRAGREPSGIALAYCAPWYKEGRSQALEDGTRRLFSGSDADVAEDIAAMRSLGVSHLVFTFLRGTLDASLAAMERFSGEVLPRVKA